MWFAEIALRSTDTLIVFRGKEGLKEYRALWTQDNSLFPRGILLVDVGRLHMNRGHRYHQSQKQHSPREKRGHTQHPASLVLRSGHEDRMSYLMLTLCESWCSLTPMCHPGMVAVIAMPQLRWLVNLEPKISKHMYLTCDLIFLISNCQVGYSEKDKAGASINDTFARNTGIEVEETGKIWKPMGNMEKWDCSWEVCGLFQDRHVWYMFDTKLIETFVQVRGKDAMDSLEECGLVVLDLASPNWKSASLFD